MAAPTSSGHGDAGARVGRPVDREYQAKLASMSLESLKQEPWKLRAAQEEVMSDLTALSLRHYRLHIENSECASTVKRETMGVRRNLTVFDSHLGSFTEDLLAFQKRGALIQAQHQRNRHTLRHHTQLLDLLEVPQVMETCVRNGLYDKALDVAKFASTLHQRHNLARYERPGANGEAGGADATGAGEPSVGADGQVFVPGADGIIHGIVRDVREAVTSMREQLLRELRGKLSLPACLRLVGYLRTLYHHEASFGGTATMDSRTAAEAAITLRLKQEFLACRDAWHTHELDALAVATPYNYLLNAMELQRTQWSDIIAQYKAVFNLTQAGSTGAVVPDATLHAWLARRVLYFVDMLEELLGRISGGSATANVLDRSSFCAQLLGRSGADFRSLLPGIFENRMLAIMESQWSAAAQQFYSTVVSWEWAYRVSLLGTATTKTAPGHGDSGDLAPPTSFMQYPPLAELTNAFLASLNDLRHCAITSLGPALGAMLEELASYLTQALHAAQAAAHSNGAASGRIVSAGDARERYRAMCQVFATEFLPYVSKCLHAVMQIKDDGSLCSFARVLSSLEHATLYIPPHPTPAVPAYVPAPSVATNGTAAGPGAGAGANAGAADNAAASEQPVVGVSQGQGKGGPTDGDEPMEQL